jgi:hypothetical protein
LRPVTPVIAPARIALNAAEVTVRTLVIRRAMIIKVVIMRFKKLSIIGLAKVSG